MKHKFLKKGGGEEKLILFFNGWGMDEGVISHLDAEGFDLCIFYHYDNDFSFDADLTEGYKKVYLIAWSMGVWAASRTFKGTIDNFSERNKQKFDRRMLSSKEDFERLKTIEHKRTLENQLSELKVIYDLAIDTQEEILDFSFDKIIVGTKDFIFPTKNQINFWSEKTNIKEIEASHFPFFLYKKWSEIIDL